MSTNYDVHCASCRRSLGLDGANYRPDFIRHLIANREAIAALAPVVGYELWLASNYGSIDAQWFKDHAGHPLVVIDEYGRVEDACGARFVCGRCQTGHYCSKPPGHDGECAIV